MPKSPVSPLNKISVYKTYNLPLPHNIPTHPLPLSPLSSTAREKRNGYSRPTRHEIFLATFSLPCHLRIVFFSVSY